jgi:hypothetical protein
VPTVGTEERTTLRPRTGRFSHPSLNSGNTLTAALAYQGIVTSDSPEWNQDHGLLDWLAGL